MDANSKAFYRSLGKHIGVLRKERDLTQAELSRMLGVSQQSVFAYELGDRRVNVLALIKLARIFDVPVASLIGMVKSQEPSNRRLSLAGLRHAERYLQLPKKHQRFVSKIMDVLLERVTQK